MRFLGLSRSRGFQGAPGGLGGFHGRSMRFNGKDNDVPGRYRCVQGFPGGFRRYLGISCALYAAPGAF